LSLTTRSSQPHSRATRPHKLVIPPGARRFLHISSILAVPILSACADRVTDPASKMAPSSASAVRSFPTELSSVGWQAQARSLVAAAALSPIVAARDYALLGVAQYGAVVDADNSVDADGLLQSNGQGFGDGGRSRFEARRGAVAAASADMLWYLFFPTQTTMPAQFAQRLADEGAAGPGGVHPSFTRGLASGHAWAAIMKAWAAADGFSRPVCTTAPQSATCWPGAYPAAATGVWISNPGVAPAGPQFGAMKPYFLTSPSQFHPLPPPAVGSTTYVADLAEVSSYSTAVNVRTPAQLAEAINLNLNVGSITPVGRWDEMASGFIAEMGFDERAAAHVFALTNAAAMDAVIGCWEAKYTYYYWRPWAANPLITSLPIGKPNHSSYPSGHSCVSAASAEVLKSFFPETEQVAALEDLVIRNGMSRIYAGIHYRFDITAGQALGRSVAATAIAYDRANGLLAAVH
jgi:membrane-associated phospholipid phosphatase